MDVDTLVRHDLPVVMVMGNNSAWGLEKGPMQMLYGYDVAADLAQRTPYDDVVKALGGAGETVTDPQADRARRSTARTPPACPTWSTSSPTSRRPTRATPSASERGLRRIRPEEYAATGDVHRRGVRDRSSRAPRTATPSGSATPRPGTARPRSGWPSTTSAAGLGDLLPARLDLARDRPRRRGRVPDAGGRPGARGAGASATRWRRLCEDRARADGLSGVALSSLATMTDAHRLYDAARLHPGAGPRTGRRCPGVRLLAFRKAF